MTVYGNFGTISHGTLRTEDLLEAFADELEYLTKAHGRDIEARNSVAPLTGNELVTAHIMAVDASRLIDEAREWQAALERNPDDTGYGEDASEIVNELADALNEYAPPYAYFGANEGDGSDFGFWLSDGALDDFDGLKVSDTSEVPDDYVGEVLHVNDHGNATLYARDDVGGELREIWSVV